jgi:hypothetical protein
MKRDFGSDTDTSGGRAVLKVPPVPARPTHTGAPLRPILYGRVESRMPIAVLQRSLTRHGVGASECSIVLYSMRVPHGGTVRAAGCRFCLNFKKSSCGSKMTARAQYCSAKKKRGQQRKQLR